MRIEIVSLQESHLEQAAELVAGRYQALRGRLPVLPLRYEGADAILPLLRDLASDAEGVVALRDGRLAGFMMGLVIPEFMGWRSAWSPEWAHGAALDESRRIYEEMYTQLSDRWISDGCYTHLVSAMAHDRQGLVAWNWLGFGLVNVDGVRPLTLVEGGNVNAEVRQATSQEAQELTNLGRALERHMVTAPTFWLHELQDFGEWVSEPGNAAWLAYEAGQAVGFIALEPGSNCDCLLLRDDKTINICGAFTREVARNQGVATALLNLALAWAQAQGYARCAVDFESMNTLAARFWTRWFEPVSYSQMRRIDERITVGRSMAG
jgi:GNAT superfamily N-acetyltransferase